MPKMLTRAQKFFLNKYKPDAQASVFFGIGRHTRLRVGFVVHQALLANVLVVVSYHEAYDIILECRSAF